MQNKKSSHAVVLQYYT